MNGMPMNDAPGAREGRRGGGLRSMRERFSWLFRVTECRASAAVYIAVICSVMSVITILVPSMIGRAIDSFGDQARTVRALTMLVIFNVVIALLGNRQGIAIPRLTQNMAHRLRRMLHAKLLKLPISYIDAHPHGDLMSRLTNDSENVVQSLSQAIPGLITSIITLLGCVIIMLRSSPAIALVNLAVGVLALLPCSLLSRRIFTATLKQQQALGTLNASVTDNISRRKSILLSDNADFACAQVSHVSGEFAATAERMQILASVMEPMMSLIGSVAFVLTISIGLRQIESGAMTVGMLQACLIYARQILRPFIDAGRTFSQLQGCLASAGRLREVLEAPEDADEGTVAIPGAEVAGEIEFKDVSFSYIRERPLYNGLNLHIPAGRTTAIIGETGAGKTTLINLLMRFYQPDSGEILLDGMPVDQWTRRRLYGSIAVILQDHATTADTVLDSITYGCPGADEASVMEAAKAVHADGMIRSLPQGLETSMSDESILSLGQQQLIALARVPLSSARILLLDEATSSVDPYSEQLVQQAFEKLRQGRTCIVIAHRLSTIRNADNVVVIHDGRVVESGTHEELLALKGSYYRMYNRHT